ncbi:MAG TPA: (d)CMP kinase [Terriglobia bacterium]|nr:(d)CMP kinase [Terriglobia bacterium]
MSEPLIIAIDGPAGAGKSTVARMLARRLGLIHVDSGATYRAAALKVIESGVSLEDAKEIVRVIRRAEIALIPSHHHAQVLLDGQDVTGKLRTAEVTHAASVVSRLPAVRKKLVAVQRLLLKRPGVVMEGRDIGTVVFPGAGLKIFLKAHPKERARRRVQQDGEQGRRSTLHGTLAEISSRDQRDAERKASPLAVAGDAVIVDTTRLSADQVVERILKLARTKKLLEPEMPA